MTKRKQRQDRMKAVEREYRAARIATELLKNGLRADPGMLRPHRLSPTDAASVTANLEPTYLLRLFAEFEAGLRDAWEHGYHRTTTPPMRDLMEGFGAWRQIPQDAIDNAHAVRIYRNSLVHEGSEEPQNIPFASALAFLNVFLSRLPYNW